ncbi:hypothetical protein P153DRAFT_20255 [Dothidotthia symphoricarpi CBS 119687]|uniref:Uncharacterized protein n=1 Tax=Dothidotthia symphoricarpi CBS 119687 TaxID=1392245 RepID=A0A6A6AED5_9PLEO|nr:uncharacterized protein P153DRAFT_20255 [Dothidotthia symphoricarpi CBS 119687]KAF2129465.1 hypothetical protein P153DRAFT_20255 [Dothidotthia symphoricarpi CBS 119687]
MIQDLDNNIPREMLELFRSRPNTLHNPITWELIAKWQDSNPFIGYRFQSSASRFPYYFQTLGNATAEMYDRIGGDPLQRHPCKPAHRCASSPETDMKTVFAGWRKADSYKRKATQEVRVREESVIQMSKQLSGLVVEPGGGSFMKIQFHLNGQPPNPTIHTREPKRKEIKNYANATKEGVALVAREILLSHPSVIRCMPVCLNQLYSTSSISDFQSVQQALPPHFCLWIEFDNNAHTLLPVALNILGTRSRPLLTSRSSPNNDPTRFQWDYRNAELGPELQTFFDGLPLLQVTDAVLLQPFSSLISESNHDHTNASYWDVDTFAPRVFAESWYLLPCLKHTTRVLSPSLGLGIRTSTIWTSRHKELARFTNAFKLVEEIRHLSCSVTWVQQPTEAFQLINLKHVALHLPQHVRQIPLKQYEYVNGEQACILCYECTSPKAQGSNFCTEHNLRLVQIAQSAAFNITCLETPLGRNIKYSLPEDPTKAVLVKDILRRLRGTDDKHIWACDFEGICLRGPNAAFHSEIGIINCENPSIYHEGMIAYPGYDSIQAIVSEIQEKEGMVFKSGVSNTAGLENRLKNSYNGNNTHGMTPSQHQKAFKDIGFMEDEAILIHWGGDKLDITGIGRILRKEEAAFPTMDDVQLRCQTINLLQLFRWCVGLNQPFSLSIVWCALCLIKATTMYADVHGIWHTVMWDSAATRQLWSTWLVGMSTLLFRT